MLVRIPNLLLIIAHSDGVGLPAAHSQAHSNHARVNPSRLRPPPTLKRPLAPPLPTALRPFVGTTLDRASN
eukprot:3285221-Prymnesium_polylepis.1